MATFFAGFSLGLSLIVAIGSQNAFVLKQGIKKEHILLIVITCAFSDAILISLGVVGFGAIVQAFPAIETLARYGGAIFLTFYGGLSFRAALTANHALNTNIVVKGSAVNVLLMCLAFTWLNPHVYLDTVVLLGSISTQYQPEQLLFALGAITASFTFFFALGFGARLLAPLFQKSSSWKVLEFMIGVIMITIAISLLV